MPNTRPAPAEADEGSTPIPGHGASVLPAVRIDSYNLEIKDGDGFIGDRTTNRTFREMLDKWRQKLKKVDEDPLGKTPSKDLSKKDLDKFLESEDAEIAGVMHGVIEDYSQELAGVVQRFLKHKNWQETERIVVGGGFRQSRIGERVIGRCSVQLKAEGVDISLQPIENHPDEAGLIGAIQLAPAWIFAGHDGILAVDIGGTNIRVGMLEFNRKNSPNLAKTKILESECWRYGDDKVGREDAVSRLISMLKKYVRNAEKGKLKLAPFIGIGCPGIINEDGTIERGGQNLPGNWEGSKFNLTKRLRDGVLVDEHSQTVVVMHNDAVVQGLSEVPNMQDVKRWGVLTIGTGLGNARFTNRKTDD
jgi:hypothetical protein